MAIVKCKECGADVSTKAKTCPGCGAPAPKRTSTITKIAAGSFAVIFVVAMCSDPQPRQASAVSANAGNVSPEESASGKKNKEYALIEMAKDAVREVVKDGDSAKFKDVYFYNAKKGVPIACGQVNAKNSFGAYAGYQYFISAGVKDLTFLSEQTSDFHKVWNKFCTGPQK